MRRQGIRLSYANVMATVAVFIALGGGAYATHSHRIATADLRTGAVTAAKLADGAVTANKVRQRAIGPAKLAPAMRPMWARVSENGNLLMGRGALAATRTSVGRYRVRFAREIDECSWTATVGRSGGGGGTSFGRVDGMGRGDPDQVAVVTRFGAANEDFDRPFHLQVLC